MKKGLLAGAAVLDVCDLWTDGAALFLKIGTAQRGLGENDLDLAIQSTRKKMNQ